ncbi:MAG: type II secretion system protein [bacterium]
MPKKNTKKAFTLSEVLIAVGVLGVVASITAVAFYHNIQDANLKTLWKQAFADLSQVTESIMANNTGSDAGTLIGVFTSSDNMRDKFLEYLTVNKSCNSVSGKGNCWHNDGNWKRLDGTPETTFQNRAGAILNNGTFVWFSYETSACSVTHGFGAVICGAITVDVNGWKGPNQMGKDIFGIWLTKNGAYPLGIQGDTFSPASQCATKTGYGLGCSAEFLYK